MAAALRRQLQRIAEAGHAGSSRRATRGDLCSPVRSLRSQVVLLTLVTLLAGSACRREQRNLRSMALPQPDAAVALSDLHPSGGGPPPTVANPFENNAYAMSEGKRLFAWYNCSGCHAQGGGGMGPALIDDKWIYGSAPEQIYATIVEGRPNGMPSFRGKINEQELWQLVTYVRALSGMARLDVATGRDDHMQLKPSEQAMPEPEPANVAAPQ
jgi:cytochrome c oxidase cbb3-type subunit 3